MGEHQRIKQGSGPAKGTKHLQREVNKTLDAAELDWLKCETDGRPGPDTFRAARVAAGWQGLSKEIVREIAHGEISRHAFAVLTHDKPRTRAMKVRHRRRRPHFAHMRFVHRHRGTVKAVEIRSTAGGEPHWGGSGDVMDFFVEPFMVRRGLPLGSGKRTPQHNAEIGGATGSDHLTTKTTTDARDFPTFTGEDDARALAAAFGNEGWDPNSFETFDVEIDGHIFRVQILWGSAIAHGDHVHVGISYVGRA